MIARAHQSNWGGLHPYFVTLSFRIRGAQVDEVIANINETGFEVRDVFRITNRLVGGVPTDRTREEISEILDAVREVNGVLSVEGHTHEPSLPPSLTPSLSVEEVAGEASETLAPELAIEPPGIVPTD